MKLSENTINVLKNFSAFNPGISVKPGNEIVTCTPNKTVLARATVTDEFPQEFTIFDLSRFLGVLSLFDDADIEFHENHCEIHQQSNSIRYFYASSDVIVKPKNTSLEIDDILTTFELSKENYLQVTKAGSTLGVGFIEIVTDNDKLFIQASDINGVTQDRFRIELGDCDRKISTAFDEKTLKFIPGNYSVDVGENMTYFKGNSAEYWVARVIKQ